MGSNNIHFIKNTAELFDMANSSNQVSKLHISSVTELDDIKHFTKLQELYIYALNAIEFYEEKEIDTVPLGYLVNLRSLYIENDDHIKSLYLRKLQSLEKLFVSSCHSLYNIFDLRSLRNLKEIIIYDVPNIDREFLNTLVDYINMSDELENVLLDINFYNFFDEFQLQALKNKHVRFVEKIGQMDNYVYSFKMMEELNKKVLEVYNEFHREYKTQEDILFSLYEYVKHIEYDEEGLHKRNEYIHNGGSFKKFYNRYKAINSTYSAMMKKKAVCEGYINLLKYFYNLENVDLYPVICLYKNSSHVAGKALINGVELYYDPELDKRFGNHNNYNISKEEFLRNHDIIFSRDDFDQMKKNKGRSRGK